MKKYKTNLESFILDLKTTFINRMKKYMIMAINMVLLPAFIIVIRENRIKKYVNNFRQKLTEYICRYDIEDARTIIADQDNWLAKKPSAKILSP